MLQMQQRALSKSKIRGQGMTEYIIIVALIAVAAIGVYNLFGKTVRNQTGAMAAALAGDKEKADAAVEAAGKSGEKATKVADQARNLSDFTTDTDKK